MGRDIEETRQLVALLGFNPRAPMGRDDAMGRPTHVDGWFQPTRPYGARHHGRPPSAALPSSFNPRAPMGRDPGQHDRPVGHDVSTHAPLWGATADGGSSGSTRHGFNPRAPMGRDGRWRIVRVDTAWFQPTRPYGARLILPPSSIHPTSFNPRAPMGRDRLSAPPGVRNVVSTHAPLWGATGSTDPPRACSPGFNPRAPMGRDWQFMQDSAFFTYSIHFSRCVAPCATSKLPLWTCHSARTS